MGPQQPPKKLQDFNNDLKKLCDQYQYELQAVEEPIYNPWGAIIGHRSTIRAFDVSPKDQVPASTTENAAATTQPAPTPTPAVPTPPAPSVPTPPAAPVPPTTPTPNTPTDVPPVPTAPATPADPMADQGKKNEGEAQPNGQPAPSDTANPPSTENTNPQPDPASSTPDSNPQPANPAAN